MNEVDRRGWIGKLSTFVRNWTLKRLLLTQMVWWLNRSSSISQSTASSYFNATSKSTFFATNPVTVSVCKLFPLTEQPISTLGQTLGWCLIKNWDSNTSRPIKKKLISFHQIFPGRLHTWFWSVWPSPDDEWATSQIWWLHINWLYLITVEIHLHANSRNQRMKPGFVMIWWRHLH